MKLHYTFKYTILLILFLNLAGIASAQYQSYVNPLTRTLDKANAKVGSLPGSVDVNSLGAATYEIPIFISPGSAGMQPSLSIIYNSQNRDGIMGQGWNLAGLSEIRRVPKNFYHDSQVDGVDLQNTDMFALDSNRLILTSGSPYGADGTVYATEYETFVKVTAYGSAGFGPSWFEVETKDGRILEYGNTADSKVEGYGSSTVYMWRINKVTDQQGNTIKFIYNEVNGESYISRIDYTTNTAAGLTTPYNSIKFEYATRTDVNSWYVGSSKIPITMLLTQIKVETENSAQVRKYQFKYFKDNFNISLLNEIVEYGSDNTFLNSTVIGWGAGTTPFIPNYTVFNNSTINTYYLGDFNGDGRTDFVVTAKKTSFTSSDKWKLYLADTCGTSFTLKNDGFLNSNFKGFTVADLDGNGNDELLWKSVETVYYNCNPYPCNPHLCDGDPPRAPEREGDIESKEEVIDLLQPADTCWDTCWETCSYIRVSFLNYSYDGSGIVRGNTAYDLVIDNVDPGLYLVPGDFDCNGQSDYLVLYPNKSLYWARINGVNRWGMSFSAPDEVRIIDFDGDGRKEVLVIKNSNSYIYQYSSATQSFSTIYTSSSYPTKNHRIFPGDFNGDKKTDLLTWLSGPGWQLKYSTGTAFTASTNVPALFNVDPNASLSDYNYYTADFNGDGKDDILEAYKYSSASKLNVFYSRGDGIFNKETYSYSKSQINQDYFNFGDFNGDGKKDLFFYDYSSSGNYVSICFFHKNEMKYLAASIANGLNFKTKITYNRLNSGPSFYVKGSNATFPVYDFNGAYYAVSKVETEYSGSSQFLPEYYTWEGAKKHRQGKGFIGFLKIIHRTDAINTLDARIFNLNQEYFFMTINRGFSLNTCIPDDTTEVYTNTNQVKSFGNKRIFPYVWKCIIKNKLLQTTFTSTNDYDDYGNIIKVKAIYNNDEQGYGIEAIKSTTNVYQQFGNYGIPNKLTLTTDSSTYTNEPSYVRQMAFTYDSYGKLLTEKIDPSKAKELTTTFSSFNAFGLPLQTTISAPGLTSRTTVFEYDTKGRFITKITDPLGNYIAKTYYPGTGNINTETGIDGLTTTYSYDAFGRLAETITPQSNHITTSYNWDETFIDGNYSLFRITTDAVDKPYVSVYYNYLGREMKSQTENPTGTISSIMEFSPDGRLWRRSLPYLSNESNIKWTYFSYDYYGRLERDSLSPQSYTSYSYSGKTTTLTRGEDYVKSSRTNSLGNTIYSSDLGSIVNSTFRSNGQVKQMNADGTIVTFYYDEYGRQDSLVNPNTGKTSYQYNAFGEITSQTDANNSTATLQYDNLGRLTTKSNPEGNTTYTYVQNGNGKGQIQSITGPNGVSQSYTYDAFGRPTQFTEAITGDQSLSTSFAFDGWNNITTMTYPSGFSITNQYTNGYLTTIRKSDNSIIWKADSINALGQPVQFSLGPSSLIEKFSYDYYGNLTRKKISNMIQEYSYDPVKGNLLERRIKRRLMNWKTETFGYDSGNRLSVSEAPNQPAINITYDSKGNITSKSGIGDYYYNGTMINKLDSISAGSSYNPLYDNVITYTSENLTSSITQDPYQIQFLYGPSGQRMKTTLTENGDTIKTKYFSLSYEKEITGSGVRNLHYIYSPYGLTAVMIKQGTTENLYFTETDNLGSIISLLDESGTYTEKYLYDPWGRRRNPETWSYDSIPTPALIDRGFTGQEHLDEFGLINMNGRMYDPYIGRFLSVDPIIQFPGNSQSFNGYGYCLNNPLKYTDPSGMLFAGTEYNQSINAFDQYFGYMTDVNGGMNMAGGVGDGGGYDYPGEGGNGEGLNGIYFDHRTNTFRSTQTYEKVDPTRVNFLLSNNFDPNAKIELFSLGPGKPSVIVVSQINPKYGESGSKFGVQFYLFGKMCSDYNVVQSYSWNGENIKLDNYWVNHGFFWNETYKKYYSNDKWLKGSDFYWFDPPNAESSFKAETTFCGKYKWGWEELGTFSWGYSVDNGIVNPYPIQKTYPSEIQQSFINQTLQYFNSLPFPPFNFNKLP